MSRQVKSYIIRELKERYSDTDSALVVNPVGLTGPETAEFRKALRQKGIRMQVVKNSMLRLATQGTRLEGIAEVLEGPCAVLTGGDSIVDVAKEIVEWTKKFDVLQIRGAVVEGDVLGAEQAKELAKMPSRTELIGQVVTLAQSPAARIAGAIGSPASYIAGCIKSLVEKLENEGRQVAA